MFELAVCRQFDAAHYLRGYRGRCARLHGHTWMVEVIVAGEKLNEWGMLIDFRELKDLVENVIKDFDHQLLNELSFFRQMNDNPTAENIAQYVFRRLEATLKPGLKLVRVNIWESSTARASFYV